MNIFSWLYKVPSFEYAWTQAEIIKITLRILNHLSQTPALIQNVFYVEVARNILLISNKD